MQKPKTRIRKHSESNPKDRINIVTCPWCGKEIPLREYSDHLQYCEKYPPHYEAMKEQARVRPIESSHTEEKSIEFSFEENPHTRTDYHMGNVICYYLLLNGKKTSGLAEICTKDLVMLRKKDIQFYEHMNVTWHFSAFANFWDELNEALGKPFKDYSGWDKVGFPITRSYDYKGTSNEAKQYFSNFFRQVAERVRLIGSSHAEGES